MRSIYFLFLLVLLGMFSCVPHRKIVLLQEKEEKQDTIQRTAFEYEIQPMDRLFIRIMSINGEVTEFFNIGTGQQGAVRMMGGSRMTSYLVNDSGYVDVPMLGYIKLGGLTVQTARDTLTKKIRTQVLDSYVMLALANFEVTVLGEVARQGVVNTDKDFLTIYDALALSGNFSQYADRKNVKLVRKDGDKSMIYRMDLTEQKLIASEFYYLQPNDIIYVEPLKAKAAISNIGTVAKLIGLTSLIFVVERLVNVF